MDVIVSENEYTETISSATETIDAIADVGSQFLAKLDKLASMGYQSEAMNAAISRRYELVKQSLEQLEGTSQPLSSSLESYVKTIRSVDRL